MAYDEDLALRIKTALGRRPGLTEKKMFGGIGFLLHGNMCCGVYKTELILRVDPSTSDELASREHVRPFDITGRPMRGWLMVGGPELGSPAGVAKWVAMATTYVATLPKK